MGLVQTWRHSTVSAACCAANFNFGVNLAFSAVTLPSFLQTQRIQECCHTTIVNSIVDLCLGLFSYLTKLKVLQSTGSTRPE